MVNAKINRKLSLGTSALVILTATLVVGAVEIKALIAREPSAQPLPKFDAMECVKCHTDKKTIDMMRYKEDGENFLFNKDGTFKDPRLATNKDGSFKDPKIAEYLAKYHHSGTAGATEKW